MRSLISVRAQDTIVRYFVWPIVWLVIASIFEIKYLFIGFLLIFIIEFLNFKFDLLKKFSRSVLFVPLLTILSLLFMGWVYLSLLDMDILVSHPTIRTIVAVLFPIGVFSAIFEESKLFNNLLSYIGKFIGYIIILGGIILITGWFFNLTDIQRLEIIAFAIFIMLIFHHYVFQD